MNEQLTIEVTKCVKRLAILLDRLIDLVNRELKHD